MPSAALMALNAVPYLPSEVAEVAAPYLFPGLVLAAVGYLLLSLMMAEKIPDLEVEATELEANDKIDAPKYNPSSPPKPGVIPCYDPGTMQYLGEAGNPSLLFPVPLESLLHWPLHADNSSPG